MKDKWNWKTLVHKRGQIEQEKVEMRKKFTNHQKNDRNRAISNTRMKEELEKRITSLNLELQSSVS